MLDDQALNDQFLRAIRNGDSGSVKALIHQVNPAFKSDIALYMAAEQGHFECVKLLIPFSDPKADGSQALVRAASFGHLECVTLLIPVSAPDAYNFLALRMAADRGHADCVALLLPVSDPLALDHNGLTASDNARASGHPDIAGMIDAFIEEQVLSSALSHPRPTLAPKASL